MAFCSLPTLAWQRIRAFPRNRLAWIGDDAVRPAMREWPGTAVVVLSQYMQRRYAVELLSANSSGAGYLLKQRIADVATFCADLERVVAGGTVLDPEVVALMLARARRDGDALELLTDRQREVLALMAEGRTNASIARQMSITDKAVVQHVSHARAAPSDDDHRRVMAVLRNLSQPTADAPTRSGRAEKDKHPLRAATEAFAFLRTRVVRADLELVCDRLVVELGARAQPGPPGRPGWRR
jgi:hypothetical protein